MIDLVMLFVLILVGNVDGRTCSFPALPLKDGCFRVSPEIEVFRVEGEAVVLHFPKFQRVLQVRKLFSPSAQFVISRDVSAGGGAYLDKGRAQQRDRQMWFLPAEASDSGDYTITYRNETFCVAGSLSLLVFHWSTVDMDTLSYPVPVTVGEALKFRCPSIGHFNFTEDQIRWNKDGDSVPALHSGSSFLQEGGRLLIPVVTPSHAGLYTCQLTVLIDKQLYRVIRAVLLQVHDLDFSTTTTTLGYSTGRDGDISSDDIPTEIQTPIIMSPLNGTIYKRHHGSGLELICSVLTDCPMAESTLVTWRVNSQSVESSHLADRALQGDRRVTGVPGGCQIDLRLIIRRITKEEERTELKCVTQNKGAISEVGASLQLEDSNFTWLPVAVVAVTCFFVVIIVVFKPKRDKNKDYTLTQQNSSFTV